jgi:hypothetical protein
MIHYVLDLVKPLGETMEDVDAQKRKVRDIRAGMFIHLAGEYRKVLSIGIPIFATGMETHILTIEGVEGTIHLAGDRPMWTIA